MIASTFPASADDGTPAFVRDLAIREAEQFDTLVVVPRVPGASSAERHGAMVVRRFRYFPRRWEDLAHGAIIENLRARPSRYLQVLPLVAAECWAVARAVVRFRPDVVHAHWIVPQGLVATAMAPLVPRVVTTLGGDLYALDSSALRRLKGWVLRRARAVTVMNEDMRRRVVDLGAEPPRVSVLPMGADISAVPERPPSATRSDRGVRLLFVGRLVEKKGLGVLLDALRTVPTGLPLSLEVVGDGPLRGRLERAAEGLPVTFSGQLGRAQLMRRYVDSDVVVVPSVLAASGDQDGLPVALLEAMAAGCAVVASDLPGLNEAIEHDVSGLLVPPGDQAALASALSELASDDARRLAMGRAAAERARSYSVDEVGRRYRELLSRVLAS